MKRGSVMVGCLFLISSVVAPSRVHAQEAWLWLDRGVEPILQEGDEVRVYFRSSEAGYAAVFHLDSGGVARLVYPASPDDSGRVLGGRDYRVVFPAAPIWKVSEGPGRGHFFLLVSEESLDFTALDTSGDPGRGPLGVAGRPYLDPHQAMDDIVETLLPEWERVRFGLTYLGYRVAGGAQGHRLCYDCAVPSDPRPSPGGPSRVLSLGPPPALPFAREARPPRDEDVRTPSRPVLERRHGGGGQRTWW